MPNLTQLLRQHGIRAPPPQYPEVLKPLKGKNVKAFLSWSGGTAALPVVQMVKRVDPGSQWINPQEQCVPHGSPCCEQPLGQGPREVRIRLGWQEGAWSGARGPACAPPQACCVFRAKPCFLWSRVSGKLQAGRKALWDTERTKPGLLESSPPPLHPHQSSSTLVDRRACEGTHVCVHACSRL